MRPSLQKKIKIDDSSQKLKENVYLSMYPSPCQSYDPNKWLQSNDVSWLSTSLDQDIDKMLKIALPQPLKLQNRKSSSNQIIEEIDPHLLKNKKQPVQFDNKENIQNLENSKLKINMSQIICEFPIQKVSRTLYDQPKTPVNQKSFMEAIISKYQNSHKEAVEDERNFIFQDKEQIAELYPQDKEKSKVQNQQMNDQEDNRIYDEPDQSFKQNSIKEEIQIKQKQQYQKRKGKKKQNLKPSCRKKTRNRKQRVSKDEIKKESSDVIQEKTKPIKKPQNLEKNVFPVNQTWGKMKFRKEAKKYEQYQMQEFKDLLQSLFSFYIHKSEGDLKVDKMRPMQNQKDYYFQQFELWINPYVLIGPVKILKQVKLHVRFKKGYSGQIFCDKALQETLPNNQVDGKTFQNQDLILANNTEHVVKLVCCLVNIKLKTKKKQSK